MLQVLKIFFFYLSWKKKYDCLLCSEMLKRCEWCFPVVKTNKRLYPGWAGRSSFHFPWQATMETWLLHWSVFSSRPVCVRTKTDAPPQHQQQLHHHCGGLYKYTCLEMHIAALTWYVKHWPHPGIVLHEAWSIAAAAAAGWSVVSLNWDPVASRSTLKRPRS